MAHRHLGLAPDEWDELPWYRQQMYIEGFNAEFGDGEGDAGDGESDLFNESLDSLQNSGFSVLEPDEQ